METEEGQKSSSKMFYHGDGRRKGDILKDRFEREGEVVTGLGGEDVSWMRTSCGGAGGSDAGSRDRREVARRFCTATASAIRERRGLGGEDGTRVRSVLRTRKEGA